eukprot:CAMPEP_0179152472 /NCGR_PEP_ID=MMETSP0796-20121207/74092_1 /TAXON_ID=73915 /ORGANISM="Pyrodinium bahamense, Strain pbaha01" /LENGTH=106 /DNA_ID=CAMNT_0020853673 /DNA_START=46 /DNA_END=366 /DNA_ORIENTATION=+
MIDLYPQTLGLPLRLLDVFRELPERAEGDPRIQTQILSLSNDAFHDMVSQLLTSDDGCGVLITLKVFNGLGAQQSGEEFSRLLSPPLHATLNEVGESTRAGNVSPG